MRLIQKIQPLEVKRAFVTAQKMRLSREKGKKYLPKLERSSFLRKLKSAKVKTMKLNEKQLDSIIADEYKKRATAYNNSEWYRARIPIKELGVWRRAGGLPPQ
jgi:hypothetical protein